MKKQKVKALTGFSNQPNAEIVLRVTAVCNNLPGKVEFSNPPVDLATLKAEADKVSTLMVEAADGSKKVIAERNKQREVVITMLRWLVRYVEVASHDDMALFKSSGFDAVSTTRTVSPSLSDKIRKIEHGPISGQTLVWLKGNPEAFSHELRYAAIGAGGVAGEWTIKPVTTVRGPLSIDGLTPGTAYLFQARVLAKEEFTDWSHAITFICT